VRIAQARAFVSLLWETGARIAEIGNLQLKHLTKHPHGYLLDVNGKTGERNPLLDYAAKHYSGKFTRIDVRFHGALCYIDAYLEPDVPCRVKVLHLPVRHALSGSKGCGIPPFTSAGFGTSETKTGGVSLGTRMPTKSTNQPS